MVPEAFEAKLRRLLGAEYAAFAASYDRPRQVGLRLNPLKTDRFPDLSRFGLRPVAWAKDGYTYDPATRPGLHPYHEAGLYYLQEPSAMAPAALLDVQPGERVLDLCAAPGGKSTQLAAQLGGRGVLVCNEIHPGRAKILSRNLERMAVTNALVLHETPQRIAARFPHCFDRVLVDAPCSGEGMFRKEPAAAADWSAQTVAMCARRQLEILTAAAQTVAPGGRLVYSTCTFSPEENEGVIAAFLRTHPDFSVEQADAPWGAPGRPDWADGNPALEKTVRLWPHRLCGEGQFAAVLRNHGAATAAYDPLPPAALPAPVLEFSRENGLFLPPGSAVQFGETVYLAPPGAPRLDGLRVLRAGLELGTLRKGRFVPSHALALCSRTAAQTVELDPDGPEIAAWLRGETLPGSARGWALIRAGDLSIGWAKGSGGQLKNHLPKGLRRLT